MNRPLLVQRCLLEREKLRYDYMGSTEFEMGDQAKSLKRIFTLGMIIHTVSVTASPKSEKQVPVYMIAAAGFPFADYQQYLQQIAHNTIHLKELAGFDGAVKKKCDLFLNGDYHYSLEINVWFDFVNDVLWTLTDDNQKQLLAILDGIKKKWAEKRQPV